MLDQFRAQKLEWNRANNQIYDRVETSSGDSNGRTLFVQISNGGTVEDLTGATLSLAWNKKTEQGLESFEEVDAKKGQYRLFYPTGMLVNHGLLQASLVLVDVTGRIESKPFDIIVHKGTVDDEAVESDNKFTALTTALVKVSQVQAEFDGLYADKSQMMDTLHDDKKADMEALEADYSNRANTLEATYAPRLTEVSAQLAQKAEQDALNAEKARIDNLITLPEGSTTNDARLEDIKIGADGTVYDTPGNAVRKIGTDLKQNSITLTNDFTNGNFVNTGGWNASVGAITTNENMLKLIPSGVYSRLITHTINDLIPDDVYYVSVDFKPLKETSNVNFPNFDPVLYFDSDVVIGEFTTLSGISKPTDASFRFNMYTALDATAFSEYEMYVKNAIALNLTRIFGSGNEPTKEIMDKLVKESPGIWWGEQAAFTQKQLLELTKLRTEHYAKSITKNNFKIMSYNCGTWYDGVTRVPAHEVEEITHYTRRLFGEFDCDIVLGQEFAKYFDVSNTILAIPHVLDFKYDYNTDGSYTNLSDSLRCPVISRTPLTSTSLTKYETSGSIRHYVKTYSLVNGKTVCFISTLLDKDDNLRPSQMQELISVMDQEEYVILGGDFNIKDKAEYDVFTNSGYKLANGGVFGWYDTLASYQDDIIRPIDNIIVSSNIRIENVYTDTKREVDHMAIIAELSMYS